MKIDEEYRAEAEKLVREMNKSHVLFKILYALVIAPILFVWIVLCLILIPNFPNGD